MNSSRCRLYMAIVASCATLVVLSMATGCTPDALSNATRPLGPDLLGNLTLARFGEGSQRGQVGVGFINRTAYRAIGTFGGYDPQDQDTIVTFGQLGATEDLEVGPNSVGLTWALRCTRALAIGERRLIELIRDKGLHDRTATFTFFPVQTITATYAPGIDLLRQDIGFSGAPFGDPQASIPTQGTSRGITRYIGTDYLLGDVVIVTFVQDAAAEGGFRTEFTTARAMGIDTERLLIQVPINRALTLAPMNLDRLTFQLLTTFGLPPVDLGLLSQTPGTTPDKVEMTVKNSLTGDISVAFFGPQHHVVKILSGKDTQFTLDPGYYEYLVIPPATTTRPLLGKQTFNAGQAYTLSVTSI